ncbi:MAG: penicillin-binding protein 2 [Clostridia bacterium]
MNKVAEALIYIYEKLEDRFLVLYAVIIICTLILLSSLFNMQIINGKEYRENSSKRILRQETVEAPRGEIYDRNGILLASNKLSFDVEIYKVAVGETNINDTISRIIRITEANKDKVLNTFPIENDVFTFTSKEAEISWKKDFKIPENAAVEDVYDAFRKLYKLSMQDIEHEKKVIALRYTAGIQGYSYFKSAKIAQDISENSVAQIEEMKRTMPGISIITTAKRVYPYSEMASHILGYVSTINEAEYKKNKNKGYTANSMIGKTGIELSFESLLKGEDGIKRMEVNSAGGVSSEIISKEVKSGDNVTLTIDNRLQQVAEKALKETILNIANGGYSKTYRDANAGAVVVLDVETREVLAMASYPTFDPNLFVNGISTKDWNAINGNPTRPMFNRAITGTYSPASTYKMLVGLAALETGKVTVDEKIEDTGIYPFAHRPRCWLYEYGKQTHGFVNLSDAIKGSCNCYFYEIGKRTGIDTIVEYTKKFGLGAKTGIEFYGEAKGVMPGPSGKGNGWYIGDTLSASIGQSVSAFTPLQMANYIATLSSGGKKANVHVVKNVEDGEGVKITQKEYEELKYEISGVKVDDKNLQIKPEYVNAIKAGMKSVTSEKGGTSYIVFKGTGLEVAGKTGTSQVTSGSDNGLFVGFAPYDNPKIAVVAIIEHGAEGSYTANVVKPIFEEYFKISTSNILKEKDENILSQGFSY